VSGVVDDAVQDAPYDRAVKDAVRIAAADDHACAVTQAGKVFCWGAAAWGQLGYGKRGSGPANAEFVPVPATGIDDAKDVVVGGSATCAVRAGGAVSCWGHDNDGQLGLGGGPSFRLEPSTIPGLTGVERIVKWGAGAYFCAVKDDDSVWCWGGAAGNAPKRAPAFDQVPPP
jgi:alpha-tubulin suppressor-like RCC1 family protein